MLVGIVLVVTGWSLLNRLRFAHRDRRQAGPIVGDDTLAETFGIQTSDLRGLREARVTRVALDQNGNIGLIEPLELPQRVRDDQNERSQSRNPSRMAG
jgi:poly-beta-1,6-N-acetyl-D-glucosamine biosynthesis protein PgaD